MLKLHEYYKASVSAQRPGMMLLEWDKHRSVQSRGKIEQQHLHALDLRNLRQSHDTGQGVSHKSDNALFEVQPLRALALQDDVVVIAHCRDEMAIQHIVV